MIRPGISDRLYEGRDRPAEAQASSVTRQTMAIRSAAVPCLTRAASVWPLSVVITPGQDLRLRARSLESPPTSQMIASRAVAVDFRRPCVFLSRETLFEIVVAGKRPF